MSAGLTATETAVLDHLVAAWNCFVMLPTEHEDDQAEFRALIHAAQRVVAARPTFRAIDGKG